MANIINRPFALTNKAARPGKIGLIDIDRYIGRPGVQRHSLSTSLGESIGRKLGVRQVRSFLEGEL